MPKRRRIVAAAAFFAALVLARGAAAYDDAPRVIHHAEPGHFDYYVLVLGWSPTYCLIKDYDWRKHDRQCASGRAFVLHGLWPQYNNGWPLDCYDGKRPWVPSHVIGNMLDVMPSRALAIHEYKAHGTCSGLSPEKYYDVARTLYGRVSVPDAFDDPQTQRSLSPEKIEAEFLAANSWLQPDMIAVTCRRSNLFDVRICFSRDLRPQACGANESQQQLCPLQRITVPAP